MRYFVALTSGSSAGAESRGGVLMNTATTILSIFAAAAAITMAISAAFVSV